jgi:hypothetical protein
MNYMYNMSIDAHGYSVMLLLLLMSLNLLLLLRADALLPYRKKMAYLTPTIAVVLGSIIFTGTIMMAAKHLQFSLPNIAMILSGIVFIILEAKRVKPLKHLKNLPHAIPLYRDFAKKILLIQFVLVGTISAWMWL